MNILLIDDLEVFLVAYKNMLNEDYNVFTADSAYEAENILNKHNIDIIFLDIFMPETNGYEFMKKIKKDSIHKKIPIVVVSSGYDTAFFETAINFGAEDFISKPASKEEFFEKIENYRILNQTAI